MSHFGVLVLANLELSHLTMNANDVQSINEFLQLFFMWNAGSAFTSWTTKESERKQLRTWYTTLSIVTFIAFLIFNLVTKKGGC